MRLLLLALAWLGAVLALTLDELALHRRVRALRAARRGFHGFARRDGPPAGFTRFLASGYNVVRRERWCRWR